jgi:hypothetical protein
VPERLPVGGDEFVGAITCAEAGLEITVMGGAWMPSACVDTAAPTDAERRRPVVRLSIDKGRELTICRRRQELVVDWGGGALMARVRSAEDVLLLLEAARSVRVAAGRTTDPAP